MRNRANFGTGFTTIIMMLVAVVFTTLGVLALSTAQSDSKLSDKNIKFVSEYYKAEGKANAKKAEISKLKKEGVSTGDIALRVDGVTVHEGSAQYIVKVNEDQFIRVIIDMTGSEIRVTDFSLNNSSDWNPSQPLSVWEG